jgi:release factor glutamine methyltransferase
MRLYRHLYTFFLQPVIRYYLSRDTTTTIDGFKLLVMKGVFHPKLFFSTGYFYDFIKKLPLRGSLLEIGCGTGILSMLSLKKGCEVLATDISSKAVKNSRINFERNFPENKNYQVIQSDLFNNVPYRKFETIIINPPYFFKKPSNEAEFAWYCGENGEYFEKLFNGLENYAHQGTAVYMILAENCDIQRIQAIAERNKICFKLVEKKKVRWEMNFIYKLNFQR